MPTKAPYVNLPFPSPNSDPSTFRENRMTDAIRARLEARRELVTRLRCEAVTRTCNHAGIGKPNCRVCDPKTYSMKREVGSLDEAAIAALEASCLDAEQLLGMLDDVELRLKQTQAGHALSCKEHLDALHKIEQLLGMLDAVRALCTKPDPRGGFEGFRAVEDILAVLEVKP